MQKNYRCQSYDTYGKEGLYLEWDWLLNKNETWVEQKIVLPVKPLYLKVFLDFSLVTPPSI